MTISRRFVHSFIQQILVECLLCARPCRDIIVKHTHTHTHTCVKTYKKKREIIFVLSEVQSEKGMRHIDQESNICNVIFKNWVNTHQTFGVVLSRGFNYG